MIKQVVVNMVLFILQYSNSTQVVKASSSLGSVSGNYGDRADVLFSSFADVSTFQESSSFPTSKLQTASQKMMSVYESDLLELSLLRQFSESPFRWLTSANDDETFKPSPICECDCRYAERLKNVGKLDRNNVTSAEEIKLQIDKLQKALIVNPHKLSATKRKKSSANDDRPSAKSAGIVGVGILVLIVVGLFLLDLTTIKRDVGLLRENVRFIWKKKTKR